MSLSKEISQTQEGLDFSFTADQIARLRKRAAELDAEVLKAFTEGFGFRRKGLINALHFQMAGELRWAQNLYLAFADKLEQGHSVIIRPLERTEAQSEIHSEAEWGKILEPEDRTWRRVADNPYLTDFSIETVGINFPRVKGVVVKDLISSTFERPDVGGAETFLISVEQALRSGITVNLKPQASTQTETK